MLAWMRIEVAAGTDVALRMAVSGVPVEEESLSVRAGGAERPVTEARDRFGNRLHRVRDLPAGTVEIRYGARVTNRGPSPRVAEITASEHLRSSRYCEVGRFAALSQEVVGRRRGILAARAVVDWVHGHLEYVPGSSSIRHCAYTSYLARRGVCRDFAHLTATLLRAAGIPARCTTVYAPGLDPMDFHLVVEALIDGRWLVLDATGLAPREAMVPISTGRDAADTAHLTTLAGDVTLTGSRVRAVADPAPGRPVTEPISLR